MTETNEASGLPPHDSAESAAKFRAFLAEIGESQSGFARTLIRLGDPRPKANVQRHVERMASGEARISGPMHVVMTIFRNSRRKQRRAAQGAGKENNGQEKTQEIGAV